MYKLTGDDIYKPKDRLEVTSEEAVVSLKSETSSEAASVESSYHVSFDSYDVAIDLIGRRSQSETLVNRRIAQCFSEMGQELKLINVALSL